MDVAGGRGGSVTAVGVVVAVVDGTVGPTGSPLETTILIVRVAVLPLLDPVSVANSVLGATDASTVIFTVVVVRVSGFDAVLTRTPLGTEREPR